MWANIRDDLRALMLVSRIKSAMHIKNLDRRQRDLAKTEGSNCLRSCPR